MLKSSEYWDREVTEPVTPPSHSWTANLRVRHYINRSVGGANGSWPLDWFAGTYPGRVFDRVLSVGCGSGAFERDLILRGIARRVDAFDASPASIELAVASAQREGCRDSIRYWIADFNTVRLERRTYDLICFHQSLHHVLALEHLLLQVRRALDAGGLLYLDEFIGPSRTYWTDYTVRWYRSLYQFFPRSQRHFDELELPIQKEDPSEAIRSSELLSRLLVGFRIDHFRGYGGNLLAVLFPNLIVESLTDGQIELMIRAEQSLLAAGAPHFHGVIVARPRQGAGAMLADLRYRIEHAFPGVTAPLRSLVRRLRGRQENLW